MEWPPSGGGRSFTLSRRLRLGCACAQTHCIGRVMGIEPRFTKCDFQSRFQISQYAERFGNCLSAAGLIQIMKDVIAAAAVRYQYGCVSIPPELIQRLAAAKSVAVLTGAGVSAESGVPTFRDAQTGLWAKYRPEDLATPRAFRRNPRLVWEWYQWRRKLVADAKPNPAHQALARMESLFQEFHLITQNVDGLHGRAGSRNVIELHGNITRTK